MVIKASWLKRCVRLAVIVTLSWLVISYGTAYKLTRRPRAWFAEPPPAVDWGTLEPHRLRTRDGHDLGAWLVRGADDGPSVLLLHGHAGSRRNCLERARLLAAEGCSVLLVSLRAHGDSTGIECDIGYSSRHDVIAAVEHLERLRPGKPLVIHGTSMGAAAAVFAAGELRNRVAGYLLECPYRDLKTAVWNRTENALPPLLDWIAYRGLVLVSPLVLPELEKIAPVDAIRSIPEDVPVLTMAGEADRLARPDEARALHDRVKTHGTLAIFEGAGHLQMQNIDPGRYRRLLTDFVRALRRPTRAGSPHGSPDAIRVATDPGTP